MQCPVDGATLLLSERQGVEIDYCPQCRGVWLDRGELDKLLERDDKEWRDYDRFRGDDRHDRGYVGRAGGDDDYRYRRRKKKGLLSEIFDFD